MDFCQFGKCFELVCQSAFHPCDKMSEFYHLKGGQLFVGFFVVVVVVGFWFFFFWGGGFWLSFTDFSPWLAGSSVLGRIS
jgi:hypothetical protein